MIRRTLLSSLVALLLVAAPAVALPSAGLALSPAGWFTVVLDGVLDLFDIEKSRADNDPNGQPEDAAQPILPQDLPRPDLSIGPETA